jgi:hypothetical protein
MPNKKPAEAGWDAFSAEIQNTAEPASPGHRCRPPWKVRGEARLGGHPMCNPPLTEKSAPVA